ncbi:hypothetical protein ELI49_30810 (plasmid) [Rhizobium ruizarguesonis]|uniref:Uncharacterized protein n=2 Tax=Rhizobium ruizarguesonis TaxID=2081791 RepID=A0AAE8Q5E8_9HYPH|nr:hypothetical protein [Rhizobium ruizarguesonis]NEH89165.1 hypothetical protein [Rhizobium ruizarguesonis]NEJ08687.1 hypothetical protein [Rhizobium ruizarguesonis]NEJ18255.1 hypothetical protein [Rhizobium ruizarguesonis]NEJ59347.1 hypothetical protein [Rhizobium ruizarguesonis]NEJ66687.1 hypothetical protein [Rhizobium ruizarguesonis]
MTANQNLMLYAKLAGFQLIVLANSLICDSAFSQGLHERLIDGLHAAIDRVRTIIDLERQRVAGDEFAAFQLDGEIEIFGRFTINLLDEIDIDYDTHEYRLDGGRWISAVAVDDTGAHVDYPELVALTDEELGSLAPLMRDIVRETGIAIHARRLIGAEPGPAASDPEHAGQPRLT